MKKPDMGNLAWACLCLLQKLNLDNLGAEYLDFRLELMEIDPYKPLFNRSYLT